MEDPDTDTRDYARRLIWHGVAIFLLGLLAGIAIPAFANPRMGLSTHLGALMTGTFAVAIGLVWLQIPPARAVATTFRLGVFGFWGTCLALVLAAVFGTSAMTPIAGAGHAGAVWQEAVVNLLFVTTSLAVLAFTALVLWNLGRK